ncbi:hypothetical protein CBFG_03472 [Clostridiales bacterium 1_7_47FAA]|nr:hypothetical protein CBFG_03472 [Clostridiales bacterium 1_7_47FAA]
MSMRTVLSVSCCGVHLFTGPSFIWNHSYGAIHMDSFDCQAVQIVESNFQTRPILHIDIWHIFL